MAVERVERLLRDVTQALDSAAIPYAVVGGNAVAAWVASIDMGAVRATKDVDILIRPDTLGAVTVALQPLELLPVEVLGVTMYVHRHRPNPRTGVHIVFAGQRVRPEYAHPAPEVTQSVRVQENFLVIDLPALVAMKLQAFRDIDRVHLRDMMSIELISPSLIAGLPADLRERFAQLQASGA